MMNLEKKGSIQNEVFFDLAYLQELFSISLNPLASTQMQLII